jgi:transcriptional regulator with XRE-family HTH domain
MITYLCYNYSGSEIILMIVKRGDIIKQIAEEIRRIRKNKGITLKKLSEDTELSISFLSQIERGISSMTITSLKKIADALGVTMQDLVSIEENQQFTRKKENQLVMRLEKSFPTYIPLSGQFEGRKLESLILKMAPHDDIDTSTHAGEEFYYVVSGSAIFTVGDDEYIVSKGETIHYPSTIPHKVSNPNDVEFVTLCVLIPKIF